MKIRNTIALLIAASFSIFSLSVWAGIEPSEGEKLITYQPDPETWEIANKDLVNSKRLVWFNKEMRAQGRTYDDFYEVSVFNKPRKKNLEGVRVWSDKKGSLKCRQFESVDISRDADSEYPSVTWRTKCQRGNAPLARLITKLIEGERNLYQVQKAWVGKADQADIDAWLDHVEEAFVCNLNSETSPCPATEQVAADPIDELQSVIETNTTE